MTCIAGVVEQETGRVWMGADSAGTGNWDLMLSRHPKVVRNGPFLFGVTGHWRVVQVLEHAFAPPEHPTDMALERYIVTRFTDAVREALKASGYASKTNEQEKQESEILVGYRGRLFALQGNYQLVEPQESYYAVGSGDIAALGALFATASATPFYTPKERVLLALQAGERFNAAVRGPFTILSLEPHTDLASWQPLIVTLPHLHAAAAAHDMSNGHTSRLDAATVLGAAFARADSEWVSE